MKFSHTFLLWNFCTSFLIFSVLIYYLCFPFNFLLINSIFLAIFLLKSLYLYISFYNFTYKRLTTFFIWSFLFELFSICINHFDNFLNVISFLFSLSIILNFYIYIYPFTILLIKNLLGFLSGHSHLNHSLYT